MHAVEEVHALLRARNLGGLREFVRSRAAQLEPTQPLVAVRIMLNQRSRLGVAALHVAVFESSGRCVHAVLALAAAYAAAPLPKGRLSATPEDTMTMACTAASST